MASVFLLENRELPCRVHKAAYRQTPSVGPRRCTSSRGGVQAAPGSSDRVLWLTGLPGSGKSILSAYLVNILQSLYREAQVLYFFCRAGVGGVDTVLDIVRTLSQQASITVSVARSLRTLKRQTFSIDVQLGISMLVKKLLLDPLAEKRRTDIHYLGRS